MRGPCHWIRLWPTKWNLEKGHPGTPLILNMNYPKESHRMKNPFCVFPLNPTSPLKTIPHHDFLPSFQQIPLSYQPTKSNQEENVLYLEGVSPFSRSASIQKESLRANTPSCIFPLNLSCALKSHQVTTSLLPSISSPIISAHRNQDLKNHSS